jgi:polyphosphate kinase 2 (PPK2 family)
VSLDRWTEYTDAKETMFVNTDAVRVEMANE